MATGAVETMTVALDKVRALGRCPGRRWGGSTTRGLFCSQRTWASPRTTPENVSSPLWRSGGATITPPEVANTGPGVNRGSGGGARGCGFEERVGVHARSGGVHFL